MKTPTDNRPQTADRRLGRGFYRGLIVAGCLLLCVGAAQRIIQNLQDLNNVKLPAAPGNGDALIYNTTLSAWTNGTAGVGTNAFNTNQFLIASTISVNSGAPMTNLVVRSSAGNALTVNTNVLVVATNAVGIGTDTPTDTLTVAGTMEVSHGGVASAGGWQFGFGSSAQSVLNVRSTSTVSTDVGINNGSTGGKEWVLLSSGSGHASGVGKLLFLNNDLSIYAMAMTTNGDVGIGTNSPSTRLHVLGAATANDLYLSKTITAVGTTGNQEINKAIGRVNIAAAGTSVIVTNSLVTTNSIIHAVAATADATARVTSVVAGTGIFTINTPAVTAETAFNWIVVN